MVVILLVIASLSSFYLGYKWGDLIIQQFKSPTSLGRIFPGQRWRIIGVGDVIIYSAWDECIAFYKSNDPSHEIRTMNRPDFEEGARDMNGRDGKGRFRGSLESRVLKFSVVNGKHND